VSDADALVAFAYDEFKIVVEPGGAVALAAALAGKLDCRNKAVAVVCSGDNVDSEVFCAALDLAESKRRADGRAG
jgi:threonine dehydratase